MKKYFRILFAAGMLISVPTGVFADVLVKQRVTMGGMKMQSTKMIKGSRERTETKTEFDDPAASALYPQVATITQCDLKRKVQLSDKKRLYLVEPLQTMTEQTPRGESVAEPPPSGPTRKGGTVTMTTMGRDTGERRAIFGMQARHIITTMEMNSSADSCNGASQMKMEYDGWYVDFAADFSCPIKLAPQRPENMMNKKPDCMDRYVTKASGVGDPGFLLEGTMKMFGPDGKVQMSQTTETLELTRTPLDQAFFEIPSGYAETRDSQDLYKISRSDYANAGQARKDSGTPTSGVPTSGNVMGMPGMKSVGLSFAFASGGQAEQAEIQAYVQSKIAAKGLRPTTGAGDYNLKFDFRQVKESTGSKIGGMFSKATGVGAAAGSVTIDMVATLSGAGSGEAKVKNKFDGPLSNAVKAAVDEALNQLLANIK
ncbi:MAG: hypothetical protein ACJ72Z_08495 [Pyrinomonadaceae bacterium]